MIGNAKPSTSTCEDCPEYQSYASGEMTCDRSKMEEIGSFSFPNNFRILDDVDNFKCQFSS